MCSFALSRCCASILILIGFCVPGVRAAEVRPDREGTELFVDDVMIQRMQGVKRTLHQAKKLDQPVIQGDKPWEQDKTYIYGTVLRDEKTGQLRMWYSGGGMAYAVSEDGIQWTKPELNFHQHNGKPTNVLMKGTNLCFILYDPADPDPAKRYKALDNTELRNFIGFHSADGLEWHTYEQKPLVPYGSELSNGIRDPRSGKYYVYIRPHIPRFHPKNMQEKRLVSVITSSDFVNWSEPKLIIQPDSVDDAWVTNPVQRTEFYSMSGFAYGNQYLGLLPVFRVTEIYEQKVPGQSKYEGPIDAQLVTSRDGLTWHRSVDRTPVIPTGPNGYDAGCIMNVASTPVIVGDEIFYYYTALSTTHGGISPPKKPTIALARWRLDGFASLDAGDEEGVIETKSLRPQGSRLEINADASKGRLSVEVLDSSGKVIPGYSAGDCRVVNSDSVRHAVVWSDKSELPTGQPYQLRFRLTNASIFSYRIHSDAK